MVSPEQLQTALPDLLFSQTSLREPAYSQSEWQQMLQTVNEQRVAPLLHWRLSQHHQHIAVPEEIQVKLKEEYQKTAMRALAAQRELAKIHDILTAAKMPYIALKGAYLAFHSYPNAALRPLRDIDILVPEDRLLETAHLFLDQGYEFIGQGNIDAIIKTIKHLPPMRSPVVPMLIEFHQWLCNPLDATDTHKTLGDSSIWSRRVTASVADRPISYLSDTDLLLHLIIHASYQHSFNNGPLTISDLTFLIQQGNIDWQLFWRLVDRGDWHKGCLLTLKLVQRYNHGLNIIWPDNHPQMPNKELQEIACQLMFAKPKKAGFAISKNRLFKGRLSKTASTLFSKIFASPRTLSARYPVSEDSLMVYLYYPVYWYRLFVVRMPLYFIHPLKSDMRNTSHSVDSLKRWLDKA